MKRATGCTVMRQHSGRWWQEIWRGTPVNIVRGVPCVIAATGNKKQKLPSFWLDLTCHGLCSKALISSVKHGCSKRFWRMIHVCIISTVCHLWEQTKDSADSLYLFPRKHLTYNTVWLVDWEKINWFLRLAEPIFHKNLLEGYGTWAREEPVQFWDRSGSFTMNFLSVIYQTKKGQTFTRTRFWNRRIWHFILLWLVYFELQLLGWQNKLFKRDPFGQNNIVWSIKD